MCKKATLAQGLPTNYKLSGFTQDVDSFTLCELRKQRDESNHTDLNRIHKNTKRNIVQTR